MNAVALRKRLYPLTFMLLLTLLFMSTVTGAHLVTRDRVERNRSLFLKRAVMEAAGLTPPADGAAAEQLYREKIVPASDGAYDAVSPDGAVKVLPSTGPGLWGRIDAMVGFREDGTVAGIAFTAHNETPGLGARIQEPWFREQLAGKKPPLELVPERTRSKAPDKIDAITGASITSKAVRDLVNKAWQATLPPRAEEGGPDAAR